VSESALSFWGWGYEHRFPDPAARAATGRELAAFLGGAELSPRSPPRLEDLRLAPARVQPPSALAALCSASPRDRASHTYGRSYGDILRGFEADFSPAPDLVARPTCEDHIDAILAWAGDAGLAVIPFGGGTSVVGGVEPSVPTRWRATVSLDLRALDRVLEVDPVSRAARIQAGATGPRLEAQLATHGLTLRHFPQSFELSTLGGWLATRAGGHFATLYTHIDDLTESIRMLTPTGVWESRRLPGSGAGPSPDRLVLGSEGILGVITEAWMRVRPRPRHRSKATVAFRAFGDAVAAARDIAQADLHPANCRVLDAREAVLNRVPSQGASLLLLGFESDDHALGPWIDRALELARARGGASDGPVHAERGERAQAADADAWKAAFVDMPYLLNVMVSLGVVADTFETACTWDRFDELHARVVRAVKDAMTRECGKGLVTCRFTHVYPDGPAPYFTFIAPGRDGRRLAQWRAIKQAAYDAVLAAGGTITHHHAVGRLHRPWYDQQRPAPFAAALRAAKHAVDPAGVLNPGVLID
jgi:alkyldihydroxyacetonephosphate synthase